MVEYHLDGYSYRETATVFGVNKNTVMKWVHRYKEEGLKDKKMAPIYTTPLSKCECRC